MHNFKDFKFRGAWITPDGRSIETDDIQSHHSVLNRSEVRADVMSLASEMNINMDDITVAAMKVGYIRILNYGNQVAVELISCPSNTQVEMILSRVREYRLDLYRQFAVIIDEFVLENPETMNVKTFHSVSELGEYLNSISWKQEH